METSGDPRGPSDRELEQTIRRLLEAGRSQEAIAVAATGYESALKARLARELRSSPQSAVEDVHSEVWKQVVESIDHFQHKSLFKTWLFSIALRTAWRHNARTRRSLKRERSMSSSERNVPAQAADAPSWKTQSKAGQLREQLDSWMRSVLSSLENSHTWDEIARHRNTTVHACTSRWQRGIRKLRRFLGRKGHAS